MARGYRVTEFAPMSFAHHIATKPQAEEAYVFDDAEVGNAPSQHTGGGAGESPRYTVLNSKVAS